MNNHLPKLDVQFSVFLANKPGLLARVLHQLAAGRINIVALSMMDSSEHGVLRLIAEEPRRVRAALQALDVPAAESEVLTAVLPNRPGALADVIERLAGEHINVQYAYCTAGAPGGRALGVFKVSNPSRAIQVLAERKPKRDMKVSIRAERARRK